jgi:histidine triad (HIT) family protein
MPSIFTQIINRQIPAYIVAEDSDFIAFLDIHPITKGHTLVVPKIEVDYVFDLEAILLSKLLLFAKRVAKGIQEVVPCLRIGMATVGLEIPHAHLHLIPLNAAHDIDFKRKPLTYTAAELNVLAEDIKAHIVV